MQKGEFKKRKPRRRVPWTRQGTEVRITPTKDPHRLRKARGYRGQAHEKRVASRIWNLLETSSGTSQSEGDLEDRYEPETDDEYWDIGFHGPKTAIGSAQSLPAIEDQSASGSFSGNL